MDTLLVPTLSAAARQSLDRHIERALRQQFRAGHSLRNAVHQAATEMVASGASNEVIRALLSEAVREHPRRPLCDRVSILTGRRTSDVLTRQILGWAEQPCGPAGTWKPTQLG